MSDSSVQLPSPAAGQAYCDVSALNAGRVNMPAELFVSNASQGEESVMPCLSFLIHHHSTGTRMLFDLGIRNDIRDIPPFQKSAEKFVLDSDDVCTSLDKGDLGPGDITYVVLSHCHWDPVGDTRLFPRAQFVVGSESRSLFEPGYPADPTSTFLSGTLPEGRTQYLDVDSGAWKPIGPFPKTLDFFGDGSMYLVDAPGHLPGHMNLLVRTSSDGGWIYLVGDAAHDWRLLLGESEIGMFSGDDGVLQCMHRDKAVAEETIRRIQKLLKVPRVRVVLAHDKEFERNPDNKQFYFPGKIASL